MTDSLLPANIFFITATIAIIVVTILSIVAAVYLIKILRDARTIVKMTKEQTEHLVREIEEFRHEFQKNKTAVLSATDFLVRFIPKNILRRR